MLLEKMNLRKTKLKPKSIEILLLIIVFSSNILSQTKPEKTKEILIPKNVEIMLLDARTIEPELTIDVYLKIIASGKIKNKKEIKKLLEDAFYLSFNTKEKVPRKITSFEGQVLTIRPTFISYSQKNNLDALTLQTRIVSEILKIDRVRAFELFNEISPNLLLKPLSCQDFLLYETSSFYELVGKIAEESFSSEQIKQGQRIAFLSPYIENMTSPSQVSPIIKIFLSTNLTNDEMLNLAEIFNKSLRKIFGDDRSFSYQMNFDSTGRDIFQLYRKFNFSPALYNELSCSYKDFLQKNLKGKRCQDTINYEIRTGKTINEPEKNEPEIKLPVYIAEANNILFKDLPISIEDINPSEIEKIEFPTEYFTNGKSKEIFRKIRSLQKWEEENKTLSEIKESQKWQEEFSKTLEFVNDLKELDNEDEIDIFHQKCLLLRLLLVESPNISFKEKVLNEYLKLLNNKQIEREYTPEWFLEFDDLKQEILEIKSVEEQEKLLGVVKNTNNSAIRVYLDLEKELNSKKNSQSENVTVITPSK